MSIVKDIFSVSRKTFFNPSAWVGYRNVAGYTTLLYTTLKTIFSTPVPQREETFEQAMKRLQLTEEDVVTGISKYRAYAVAFVICGLASLLYGFFLLFKYGTFIGWLLAMAMTALFCSQAFQYDFWSFQMRKRKLGLTSSDYFNETFGNKGTN
jgi:intracellular multiplication protein IcmV